MELGQRSAKEYSLKSFFAALGAAAITYVFTAFGLKFFNRLVEGEAWFSSAVFHSVASVAIIIRWGIDGKLVENLFGRRVESNKNSWIRLYFLEIGAVLLTVGTIFLCKFSQFFFPSAITLGTSIVWQFVTWIPIVEEIFYRGFLGSFFLRRFPSFYGIWFSSLVFAMAHLDIGMGELAYENIGVPMGPFLLGLTCMFGYYWNKSLLGAIFFHAAANGTVYIFSSFDARWLEIFSILYF